MVHINIKHSGHQLLVLYGGRNDRIYDSTGNVALNDICVYNCNLMAWEPLAMFNQMPCSRWSHTMIPLTSTQSYHEGFIVFGGVNLKAYCKSKFYTFTFSHKKAIVDEKPNNVFDLKLDTEPDNSSRLKVAQIIEKPSHKGPKTSYEKA